ncbi:MAG: sigma-70 family RNA polymerase sigma factor [Dehalococcoidia bacterium]|nr:sigma-70 family RNA polymerase sigma factor [Dehalococcoidia bacterium]
MPGWRPQDGVFRGGARPFCRGVGCPHTQTKWVGGWVGSTAFEVVRGETCPLLWGRPHAPGRGLPPSCTPTPEPGRPSTVNSYFRSGVLLLSARPVTLMEPHSKGQRVKPQPSGEAALVEQAKADPQAFGVLYDRYVDRIYRLGCRRFGSHVEAQDLTSQSFQRAMEALPGYRSTGASFGAWLYRIAVNLANDRWNERRRLSPLGQDGPEDPAGDLLDEFLAEEERSELWREVDRLPPHQRRVLTLRFGQGLSNQEVSRIINRSETATKQLVYRSLVALRARVNPSEGEGRSP